MKTLAELRMKAAQTEDEEINWLKKEIAAFYEQDFGKVLTSQGGIIDLDRLDCYFRENVFDPIWEYIDKNLLCPCAEGTEPKKFYPGGNLLPKKISDLFYEPLKEKGWTGRIFVLYFKYTNAEGGIYNLTSCKYFLEVKPMKKGWNRGETLLAAYEWFFKTYSPSSKRRQKRRRS